MHDSAKSIIITVAESQCHNTRASALKTVKVLYRNYLTLGSIASIWAPATFMETTTQGWSQEKVIRRATVIIHIHIGNSDGSLTRAKCRTMQLSSCCYNTIIGHAAWSTSMHERIPLLSMCMASGVTHSQGGGAGWGNTSGEYLLLHTMTNIGSGAKCHITSFLEPCLAIGTGM